MSSTNDGSNRFWGHTFYDWDEIVLPNALSEFWDDGPGRFSGIALDYRRFMSDSILALLQERIEVLKQIHTRYSDYNQSEGNVLKVWTNFAWAPYLDMVSWDNYPISNDGLRIFLAPRADASA